MSGIKRSTPVFRQSSFNILFGFCCLFFSFVVQEKSALTTSTEVHILWIDREYLLAGDQRISMFYVRKIYIECNQIRLTHPSIFFVVITNELNFVLRPSFSFTFFNISHLHSLFFFVASTR